MVSEPKHQVKFVKAMICAVDPSWAVELSKELARLWMSTVKATAGSSAEGVLSEDLIQFYTGIQATQPTQLRDAVIEFLTVLKPNRQSLVILLDFWKVCSLSSLGN